MQFVILSLFFVVFQAQDAARQHLREDTAERELQGPVQYMFDQSNWTPISDAVEAESRQSRIIHPMASAGSQIGQHGTATW